LGIAALGRGLPWSGDSERLVWHEAGAALATLDTLRRPFRLLDYERSPARAWVTASQGAISEAIAILLSAAKKASARGQFAAEVICLQTATEFGDRTSAPRLRELKAIVEGPRVAFAARFAAALRDGDAAELSAVSEDFAARETLWPRRTSYLGTTITVRRGG
jgi:hypothetical protein